MRRPSRVSIPAAARTAGTESDTESLAVSPPASMRVPEAEPVKVPAASETSGRVRAPGRPPGLQAKAAMMLVTSAVDERTVPGVTDAVDAASTKPRRAPMRHVSPPHQPYESAPAKPPTRVDVTTSSAATPVATVARLSTPAWMARQWRPARPSPAPRANCSCAPSGPGADTADARSSRAVSPRTDIA